MISFSETEAKRRDEILNAALNEFTSQGYDKASTNKIAKEAGMSKALMFHYIGSKQELFLYVFDYFIELMQKEYYSLMDYNDNDIFNRLRQSYRLQINLMRRYPHIVELEKLACMTESDEINKEIYKRKQYMNCLPKLFAQIDETNFNNKLGIERCKQYILWINIGFTNKILEEMKISYKDSIDSETIMRKINSYLDDLQMLFYTENRGKRDE